MPHYSMNMTFDEIQKSLQEKFYIHVPFPIKRGQLESVVQSFFKFLEEPDHIKNYIDFTIAPEHRRGDVGFKHRNSKDDIYNDSKDFFHFHPAVFEKHHDFLESHPVIMDFMLKAQPIWSLASETVYQILKAFEFSYPGACAKVFDTEYPHILLRFLKYDWQTSGKYLAKPHYDAGSFTLAIAESCQGLRIGSHPENLQPVKHLEDHAVFMFSSNFQKVIDTDHLSAGWHDVIQLDETLIGRPFARWAVVAFIEAHGVEALPRTETHKWYRPSLHQN